MILESNWLKNLKPQSDFLIKQMLKFDFIAYLLYHDFVNILARLSLDLQGDEIDFSKMEEMVQQST